MTSVSTPSSASVQEALKRMSLLKDNDLTAKAVRDMIAEVEGRKPRKKKAPPQPTIVYNTVYNSGASIKCDDQIGNSNAQRNLDATITIIRRLRLFVVSVLETVVFQADVVLDCRRVPANLPTRDDLRLGELDLGEPLLVRK